MPYSFEDFKRMGLYCPRDESADGQERIEPGEDVTRELTPPLRQKLATCGGGKHDDPSREDFAVICAMLDAEHTPEDTLATFKASPRGKDAGVRHPQFDDYCQRTLSKAVSRQSAADGFSVSALIVDGKEEALYPTEQTETFDTIDLPDACLDGWLGDLCRKRMSDFPRAYAWPALLAAASVLTGRETATRCNLFVAVVGPLHSGKSCVCDRAFQLLSVEKPLLVKLKAGSAEGLADYVKNVAGDRRLLYPDELAHLLEKSMIERSSFPRFLTTAFYDDEQELTVMKRKIISFNARLSILGGIVEDQFGDLFGSATTGGLHDRFLFGKCPSGFQYLWRDYSKEPPALSSDKDQTCGVRVHKSAFEERDRWIKELKIEPRVAELCIRAAVICAAFSRRPLLTRSMMGPALAMAEYQMRVRIVLQPNPGENPDAICAFKIRSWLQQNARDGRLVTRRELYRSINGDRLGPGVFDRTLKNMGFNGELEIEASGKKRMINWVGEGVSSIKR